MKKENEFSKTLEDLEKKVSEINNKNKIQTKRLQNIEAIELKKEEEEKKRLREESITAKKSNDRTWLYIYLTCSLLGALIAKPLMDKDPVEFWFGVIMVVCLGGMIAMKGNK